MPFTDEQIVVKEKSKLTTVILIVTIGLFYYLFLIFVFVLKTIAEVHTKLFYLAG
jgi:hypothetical protein